MGHGQPVMLLGDCLLGQGDALQIYKDAFRLAHQTKALFGHLDHPFSVRYQYGWRDEDVRINAHTELISFIRSSAINPAFLSQNDAMDFIGSKAGVTIVKSNETFTIQMPLPKSLLTPSVEFKKQLFKAMSGLELQ